MAYQDGPPYAGQDPKEVAQVIQKLEAASSRKGGKKSHGFTGRKNTYDVHGTNIVVSSWKFNDWDYKRDDLPTYARGLFTYKRSDGAPEIAIRGYDKFFNVDEVNETQWRNVESFTKGPYELSVKENGCIIFISGLEDDRLLVCSKHSTGPGQDPSKSHASNGEKWIDRHLKTVGKSRIDLARELRTRNATAVAELCDDSFEEHVLAYDETQAGLYLHGINLNLPEFATYSSPMVHKFADEWGFKKAEYVVKDDIATVKTFLEGCAETGSWNGRDTEGFVIRCRKRAGNASGVFQDWFFKYKFEEPYLMYRQWREATKAVIGGRTPKYKKHQKITEEYLLFARRRLAQNPGLGKAYNQNHGIIKMRDDFLKERGLKGSDIIRQEAGEGNCIKDTTHNVILVPIATIGCGKTTVALALAKLFGWGHVQNDNIQGKGNRPGRFVAQICNNLAQYPVVIADRNNHQKRERQQLLEDITNVVPNAKYVALHYVHDPKNRMLPEIRRVTQERVLERGDNHQTIQAASKGRSEIIGIMEGFLERFQPLDKSSEPDNGFDDIIDLDVVEDSRYNLDLVVNALHKAFPKIIPEVPSESKLDDAVAAALSDYAPDIKHDLSSKSKNKGSKPGANGQTKGEGRASKGKDPRLEYFCVQLPARQILATLETTFAGKDAATRRFYSQLQATRQIQAKFHVTLVHAATRSQHPELWSRLVSQYHEAQAQQNSSNVTLGKCRVQLERVVWDQRVMCIVARLLDPEWESVNAIPHITIGTANQNIKPKESNDMLEKWSWEGANTDNGIQEIEIGIDAQSWGEVNGITPTAR